MEDYNNAKSTSGLSALEFRILEITGYNKLKEQKSLLNLTILYSIGNFSSKIISFILVFFTTFYLSKADVGAYDLILITLIIHLTN